MIPPITVVIPVHNRADLLGRALTSVDAQRLTAAQVIVVDDGSDDGSGEVAAGFGCTVIRQPQAGVSAARNRGLEAASSPWVAFLDSDDEWLPDHLSTLGAAADDGISFVSSAAITTGGQLVGSQLAVPLRVARVDRLVWPDNPVVTSAVMVERGVALDVGGFDESMRHSEDLDLWARLIAVRPGLVLPGATVRYTLHAGQASVDLTAMREGAARLLSLDGTTAATRRAIAVRDAWDDLRSSGPRGAALVPALLRFAAPRRARPLAQLLRHRAASRRMAAAVAAADTARADGSDRFDS